MQAPSQLKAVRRSSKPEVPEGFRTITEGAATILLQGEDVFYNPAQARAAFAARALLYRLMSESRSHAGVRELVSYSVLGATPTPTAERPKNLQRSPWAPKGQPVWLTLALLATALNSNPGVARACAGH